VTASLPSKHCPHRQNRLVYSRRIATENNARCIKRFFVDPKNWLSRWPQRTLCRMRVVRYGSVAVRFASTLPLRGLPTQDAPPFAAEANRVAKHGEEALEITSPRAGMEYQLRIGASEQSVPLQAQAPLSTRCIYWFAGKNYLGSSAPGETILWQATPGVFAVSAVDDQAAPHPARGDRGEPLRNFSSMINCKKRLNNRRCNISFHKFSSMKTLLKFFGNRHRLAGGSSARGLSLTQYHRLPCYREIRPGDDWYTGRVSSVSISPFSGGGHLKDLPSTVRRVINRSPRLKSPK